MVVWVYTERKKDKQMQIRVSFSKSSAQEMRDSEILFQDRRSSSRPSPEEWEAQQEALEAKWEAHDGYLMEKRAERYESGLIEALWREHEALIAGDKTEEELSFLALDVQNMGKWAGVYRGLASRS